jgi:hypothetical protein
MKRPPLRLIGGTLGSSAAVLAVADPSGTAFLVLAIAALLFGGGALVVLFTYSLVRLERAPGPEMFSALAGGVLVTTVYWTGMERGLWPNNPLLGFVFSVRGMFIAACLSFAFAERRLARQAN